MDTSSRRIVVVASICIALLAARRAAAQTPDASAGAQRPTAEADGGRPTLRESLGGNWRLTLDLSTDFGTGTGGDGRGDMSAAQTIGVDSHKVITGATHDWGTVVMQGYLTRTDQLRGSDAPHDVSFMYRIFNLNVTRFGRGRFNVRMGHFEIPFGLEHILNTNGTLRDFMHGHNLGLKADWGVGVNGSWQSGEYEFAWSRGDGLSHAAMARSYVLAGRVGTPSDRNLVLGASVFRGVDRHRVGADVAWYRGVYGLLSEVAYGQDERPGRLGRDDVANVLVEVNRAAADDRVTMYFQSRAFSHDDGTAWTSSVTGAAGVRAAVDGHWSVSAEYAHAPRTSVDSRGSVLRSQLRYRF